MIRSVPALDDDLHRWLGRFREHVAARVRGDDPLGAITPHPIDRPDPLVELLALTPPQSAFVWACVAAAADARLYPHLVTLGGADARRGLSIATYAAMTGVDPDTSTRLATWLSSSPPLVALRMITPGLPGLLPTSTPWQPAARLIALVAGEDALDPVLARAGGLVTVPAWLELDDAQRAIHERIAEILASGEPAVVILSGPPGVGRRTAVAAAAGERATVYLDAARVLTSELDDLIRALLREAVLRDAVAVVASAGDAAAPEVARLLGRALDDAPATCVVTTSDPALTLPVRRPTIRIEMAIPKVATRLALWRRALGGAAPPDDVLQEVAVRYRLGAGGARAAAAAALRSPPPLSRAALIAGVRGDLAERFAGLAERLAVTDGWDDAVLAPDTTDQVHGLVSRVRHAYRVYEEWGFPRQTARGGGVAALFSGPPGTGKTMVAGIIARELDRDLYRVDLSKIVSKWVGETEKQLGQVFDAAESGDALLLFDEADSLFAKRTEVKSSSDRYANLEVNYLLQRIETFGGVTILTTNLDTSIDAALRRRLSAHIVFWPPELDERVLLWKRFLATGAPITGTIDAESLATDFPDMTGANIRNAVLAAAFLAAADVGSLSHDLLLRAARAEYRAMGRVLGRK